MLYCPLHILDCTGDCVCAHTSNIVTTLHNKGIVRSQNNQQKFLFEIMEFLFLGGYCRTS